MVQLKGRVGPPLAHSSAGGQVFFLQVHLQGWISGYLC